jgi:hypothetical protein
MMDVDTAKPRKINQSLAKNSRRRYRDNKIEVSPSQFRQKLGFVDIVLIKDLNVMGPA